jgi:glycosyltransferase involved in cell wall biosynthesis
MSTVSLSPLVSVIVRTVNRPFYLAECLKSVARQDYPNVEIILVNDGGPTVSPLVESLNPHARIELIELPMNIGRSASGNLGLARARGDFLCFLDDDDIFYPFHISTLIKAARENRNAVVYSDAVQARQILCPFDSRVYMTTELQLIFSEECPLERLLKGNFIPILCGLVPRSILGSRIRFDPMLEVLEDWDFWIQLCSEFRFHHVPEITAEYRQRVDGTNTVGQMDSFWAWSHEYVTMKHSALKERGEESEEQ